MNSESENNVGTANPVVNNQETATTSTAKQRGRKRSDACRREIFLDPSTKKPRGKGKPEHGQKFLVVSVQRAVKNNEFVYGTTPIFNEREVVINRPPKTPKSRVEVVRAEGLKEFERLRQSEVEANAKTEETLTQSAPVTA